VEKRGGLRAAAFYVWRNRSRLNLPFFGDFPPEWGFFWRRFGLDFIGSYNWIIHSNKFDPKRRRKNPIGYFAHDCTDQSEKFVWGIPGEGAWLANSFADKSRNEK
jgi:hypothetical protein